MSLITVVRAASDIPVGSTVRFDGSDYTIMDTVFIRISGGVQVGLDNIHLNTNFGYKYLVPRNIIMTINIVVVADEAELEWLTNDYELEERYSVYRQTVEHMGKNVTVDYIIDESCSIQWCFAVYDDGINRGVDDMLIAVVAHGHALKVNGITLNRVVDRVPDYGVKIKRDDYE